MSEIREPIATWFDSTTVSVERYFLFSSLALIILFAWMEPSGAAGIGFLKGLAFWTIQISILIPLLIVIQHFASHYIILRNSTAPWIQTTLSGVVASLLFVPIAYLLDMLFAITEAEGDRGVLYGLMDEASGVTVPVTITWLALNAPWICQLDFSKRRAEVDRGELNTRLDVDGDSPESSCRFMQELSSRARGELISISSELHYLRVTTTEDEVMFLYNLKDAIAELPSGLGVQIHRSHWVAREYIKKFIKKDGNVVCVLSNGKVFPVSRRKYAEVREIL